MEKKLKTFNLYLLLALRKNIWPGVIVYMNTLKLTRLFDKAPG
jgi:hypothetical protein